MHMRPAGGSRLWHGPLRRGRLLRPGRGSADRALRLLRLADQASGALPEVSAAGPGMTRIEALADEFSRRSELAPATRAFYRWNLERLLVPFCRREGLTEPAQLTPDLVDQLAGEVAAYRKADGAPLSRQSR